MPPAITAPIVFVGSTNESCSPVLKAGRNGDQPANRVPRVVSSVSARPSGCVAARIARGLVQRPLAEEQVTRRFVGVTSEETSWPADMDRRIVRIVWCLSKPRGAGRDGCAGWDALCSRWSRLRRQARNQEVQRGLARESGHLLKSKSGSSHGNGSPDSYISLTISCAVERRCVSAGCKARPATVAPAGSSRSGSRRKRNGLKHFDGKGPPWVVQRACRPQRVVNVEQASKRLMRKPTRRYIGEGCQRLGSERREHWSFPPGY